ncbi:Hsp20/alpha crystallin family protein [Desulfurispirillum indicum]|uniref:Heat shock protein Hsp20 n=1 Tax=Desulfurispirillum indicum (strain ATCC BAA-1389 / DSM 22839 / S5) TaxID=653733 RepID=E6W140_DESIS|nr:Hsp20/alpha crystallin family protein [Desulfurispirillum indicum]ADU66460.1 heat shock protein Hsp20 [Desulfurispirillum indicum S5]UCZ55796.1 Hsp20/alpha crystallin family protein [Desulfurispirillum indicum]
MSITKWNPLHNLVFLYDRMNLFYEEVKEKSGQEQWHFEEQWQPVADVACTDKEYVVDIALPGVPSQDIHLEIVDNSLCVSGTRLSRSQRDSASCLRLEREHGAFSRAIKLERAICEESVSADYRDGILRVTLPFAVRKKVNIETG